MRFLVFLSILAVGFILFAMMKSQANREVGDIFEANNSTLSCVVTKVYWIGVDADCIKKKF